MLVLLSRSLFLFLLLSLISSVVSRGFAQPQMTVTPDPLDFLEVNLTDIKDAEIEIESNEPDPFVVQNIYLTGGNARETEFVILSPAVKTFPLMPAEKRKIIFRFSPDFEGERTRVLIIQTDLGDKVVQLLGKGKLTKPVLALNTSDLNFGQIGVSGKKEMLIEISNVGEDPAKVSDLNVANFTGIEHFKAGLNDATLSFPVILLKGEKLLLKASFEGAYPLGFKTGSLTLLGSVGGQTVVQLRGEVVAGDLKIEPSPIDFGDVEVGTPERIKVTITALGSLPLSIQYMNEMLAPLSYVVAPEIPFTIEPGTPYEFEIEINATQGGPLTSQLQVVSPDLEGSSFRSADIIANVLTPLRIAESQDFSYYCSSKRGVEREVTVGNNGINPITIESLIVPSGVTLLTDLPAVVPPGGTAVFEYSFDPAFGFGGRELVFEFKNATSVVIRDTVLANEVSAILPLVQTVENAIGGSGDVIVTSSFDFTPYSFQDITIAIDVARPDLFEIVKDSIRLNESLLPNATFDLTDNSNGSYTLVIHATQPIEFSSFSPLSEQPLFTYSPFAYVSTDAESNVDARLVIDTLCISTPIGSALLVAQNFCGSQFVHQVLRDQPLSNVVLSPNPSSNGVTRISYVSHASTLVQYKILSLSGIMVSQGNFEAPWGEGNVQISTSGLSQGNYILELTSSSGLSRQLKLVILN